METKNELEKEKLKQELEKLRMSTSMEIPNVSMNNDQLPLGSPGAEDDPYEVMKSIAFQPLDVVKRRTTSFNIRDITGEAPAYSEIRSPVGNFRFSPSPSPDIAQGLPLLSPATGQHNILPTPTSGSPIDSEMKQLLETYDIIGQSTVVPVEHSTPVDMCDGNQEATKTCFDLGYVSRNLSEFQVDDCLSRSCPEQAVMSFNTDQHPTYPATEPQ